MIIFGNLVTSSNGQKIVVVVWWFKLRRFRGFVSIMEVRWRFDGESCALLWRFRGSWGQKFTAKKQFRTSALALSFSLPSQFSQKKILRVAYMEKPPKNCARNATLSNRGVLFMPISTLTTCIVHQFYP